MLAIALARRNNNSRTLQNNQINNKKKMETIQKENKFSVAIFKSRQKK
tara:strand:+ start:268 stop:411 length:144 start_codon:yes stop_codon:yes gene_type:complete